MHKATEQLLLWPETSSQGQRQTFSRIETNLHSLRQAVMARGKLLGQRQTLSMIETYMV